MPFASISDTHKIYTDVEQGPCCCRAPSSLAAAAAPPDLAMLPADMRIELARSDSSYAPGAVAPARWNGVVPPGCDFAEDSPTDESALLDAPKVPAEQADEQEGAPTSCKQSEARSVMSGGGGTAAEKKELFLTRSSCACDGRSL